MRQVLTYAAAICNWCRETTTRYKFGVNMSHGSHPPSPSAIQVPFNSLFSLTNTLGGVQLLEFAAPVWFEN